MNIEKKMYWKEIIAEDLKIVIEHIEMAMEECSSNEDEDYDSFYEFKKEIEVIKSNIE